ncbi:MAG: GNAT family N-acetyltransferase [Eubacteriales bacterium]|nr:GNAT family N-acetyltransferase [Eubacteriales bacterium]
MEIRKAVPEDKNTIIKLWDYCFNTDSEEFRKHYFNNIYSPENTVVSLKNEIITTSFQLNPYQFSFEGKEIDTKYIVGISSFPEFRGDGSVYQIFNHIFNHLYNSEMPFVFLMAIDYGLYRPYGFSSIMDKSILSGKTKSLYQKTEKNYKFIPVSKKSDKKSIDKLTSYYNLTIKNNYSDYIIRNKKNFYNNLEELFADNGYAAYLENEEEIAGYLFYYFDKDKIVVKEMLYDNSNVLKEILKFVYNHNTQTPVFEIRDDFPKTTSLFLPNPREVKWEIMPFLMARVINLKSFLSLTNIQNQINDEIRLQIVDKNIKENNCLCILKPEGIFYEQPDRGKNWDISIDISLLPSLFFGYISPEEGMRQSHLYQSNSKEKINDFFTCFNKSKNMFFNEYV